MLKILLAALLVSSSALGKSLKPKNDKEELKDFSFDDIIPNKFPLKGFNGTWMAGSRLLYKDSLGNYNVFDAALGTFSSYLLSSQLENYKNPSIEAIGDDSTKTLIRYDVKSVFRHSSTSKYALYDHPNDKFYDVADGKDVQICKVSPTADSLVYVFENNIFYRASLFADTEVQLTFDGVPGVIYNGVPDWVYEEEVFGTDATIWFSPDGKNIAFTHFDDRNVKEFAYHIYGDPELEENQYPTEYKIRYPKVNTTNPEVMLYLINFDDITKVRSYMPPRTGRADENPYEILAAVNWISSDSIGSIWTNRRQNDALFISADLLFEEFTEEFHFKESNGWVDVYTPKCTQDGSTCFLLGNVENWRRIIKLTDGKETILTETSMTVTDINGYDAVNDYLYYTAVKASSTHHKHFYRNKECLSCTILKDKLNNNQACNFASINLNKDFSYFAATCSGPGPSYTQIFKASDLSIVLDWELNLEKRELLREYKTTQIQFLTVRVEGGFSASVRLYLPPEIDFNNLEKNKEKYPMIVQVYGGPNSVRVQDSFAIGYANYLTTTRKIIYCQIDGRGTGNQGTEFLFSINNRLGTYEMDDQILVARKLLNSYNFIDAARVGIWGSSYGGYATAMTLEKDTHKVFKCGISVAPVTSWMFYDSIYTERYMGLPTVEDNLLNYLSSDVTQYIKGMKNHQFMIIHGNADDNVHYQQTMVFMRALLDAAVEFEQMSYPDEAHSLSGVQRHLYHTMDQFWSDCFE